jgi:Hypothetical glycosyl hydrolase 6/Beta-galactosidase trimerisation domain
MIGQNPLPRSELPFRQIHLDFHTSEQIPGVGSNFDPEEFAETLIRARVNSITCFARCHHGWLYFDSKKFPERKHPALKRDLLNQQIQACHRRGIRAPIYITVQWDYYTAIRHPDWVCLDKNGSLVGTPPFEAGFYQQLCLNTPYREFLKQLTAEILETFPTDGLFFDIVWPVACVCRYCREKMSDKGLEPGNSGVPERFGIQTVNQFKEEMTQFVRDRNSDCTIFYNAGHIGPRHRQVKHAYSHFELESLPGGEWGYLHFPATIRYARTLGLECVGMTGKFHTSWGDFHSFKNLQALRYECLRMLTHGAKCMIGDQLHPDGRIDPHVYALIGQVYQEIEEKEPWCIGAKPVTEIGVLTPEEFTGGEHGVLPEAIRGATRILEQGGHQFDILDSTGDFNKYRLLILPDHIPVSADLARKLKEYVEAGGSILASYASGMDEQQNGFSTDLFGVTLLTEGPRDSRGILVRGRIYERHDYCEYLLPNGAIGRGLPVTELAMYRKGMAISAAPGTETLAPLIGSWFDRTYRHFCSHRQTPSSRTVTQPGIVQNGRCIYFSNPIFSQYDDNAPHWCKVLVLNAIERLLPDPLVKHDGPSTLQVTVTHQPDHNRWVLHLLHFIPERRSKELDVIEDVIPLFNINLFVRTSRAVRQAVVEPDGLPISVTHHAPYAVCQIPRVEAHCMVSLLF